MWLRRHARSIRTGGRRLDGLGLEERSSDLSRSVPPERRLSARGRAPELPSARGLIVRVPKLVDDPSWEVMAVPETLVIDDFIAALRLWRWQRQMEGRPIGDLKLGRPCHERDQSERTAAAL